MRQIFLGFLLALMAFGASAQEVPTSEAQLVIDFKDFVTEAQVQSFEVSYGIDVQPNSIMYSTDKITITKINAIEQQTLLTSLSKDPLIENVEPVIIYSIPENELNDFNYEIYMIKNEPSGSAPNDPLYKHQWHMDTIGMQQAWAQSNNGKGAVIAVIDTGVAYENYKEFKQVEDLKNTCFVPGYNFVDDTTHANDDHAHGTHVAGTIAQSTNNGVGVAGIAHKACIMPIKVLAAKGGGTSADVADGIRWAADHGAHVINMSLGSNFPSKVISDACKYARSKGVTIIAAAGNDGSGKVGYPAADEGVVAVSATDLHDALAFYSQWGKDVDIAAPGGDVRKDDNKDGVPDGVLQNTIKPGNINTHGYFPFMGTSMATPHVAGVAGLIVSMGIKNPDQVEKILFESANRKVAEEHGAPKGAKWDDHYGHGRLDAAKAVLLTKKELNTEITEEQSSVVSSMSFITLFADWGLFAVLWALSLGLLLLISFYLKHKNNISNTFDQDKISFAVGAGLTSLLISSHLFLSLGPIPVIILVSALIPVLLVGFLNHSKYKNWITGSVFVFLTVNLYWFLMSLISFDPLSLLAWTGISAAVCLFLGYNNLKK